MIFKLFGILSSLLGFVFPLIFSISVLSLFFSSNVLSENLTLPAVGVWNGFLRHENVVECHNVSSENLEIRLTLKDNLGASIGEQLFNVPAFGTQHISLASLVDFSLADQYGTFILEKLQGEDGALSCNTIFYRFPSNTLPKPLEYSLSLPVSNPIQGETFGIFNSMNASGFSEPVYNWLSVYNPGTENFSALVQLYNVDGSARSSFTVSNLAPGTRNDFPLGHNEGQVVGLYRIIPENSGASYGAFLTRYGQDGSKFNFAFPLLALGGNCDPGPVPAHTMNPATNWGEIANLSAIPVTVLVEIRDQAGTLLNEGREEYTLPAFSQHHIYTNEFLGPQNVGTIHVRCVDQNDENKKILVQSLFYGHPYPGNPQIEWAYASQAKGVIVHQGQKLASSVNTFLGAANWTSFNDQSSKNSDVLWSIHGADGNAVRSESRSVLPGGSYSLGVHEITGRDNIGLTLSEITTNDASFNSETIRVFPHESSPIGYIMNVPSTVVNPKDYSYYLWKRTVQPLIAKECGSCHMGKRFAFASLEKSGQSFSESDSRKNYAKFQNLISLDSPKQSRLLAKILPSSNPTSIQHGGGAQVNNQSSPIYKKLLEWITKEKEARCPDCGTTAKKAYIAYIDQPDYHWGLNRFPVRLGWTYLLRSGAKIMLQEIDPSTNQPIGAPVDFLGDRLCGENGMCDFGHISSNYAGTMLTFECKILPEGGDWVEDANWNVCLAEIGADGRAVNPRFLFSKQMRHSGYSESRLTPFGHLNPRKKNDINPIFSPDDSRIIMSSRRRDPRTGVSGTRTYHGFEHYLSKAKRNGFKNDLLK